MFANEKIKYVKCLFGQDIRLTGTAVAGAIVMAVVVTFNATLSHRRSNFNKQTHTHTES